MTLQRREKLLAVATGIAVLVLMVDAFVVRPVAEAYQQLDQRRVAALDELREARSLMQARRGAQQRWREMAAGGLSADASVAESQVLHAMRSWSAEAGLNLASMQPERRAATGPAATAGFETDRHRERDRETLREIDIAARASGSLEAVARFLYEIQTANVPIRVRRLRLSQRGEDGRLSVELRTSTVYRATTEPDR